MSQVRGGAGRRRGGCGGGGGCGGPISPKTSILQGESALVSGLIALVIYLGRILT